MATNVKLPTNLKTGKAVADIKAVYLLKHGDSGEPVISDSLSSTDWFPILTLRGSVSASQDAPSLDKINVDQFDAPIGITSEPGDFTFEANLPSMQEADIKKWLGTYDADENTSGVQEIADAVIDGKQLFGFSLDGSIYDMSVMIETRTNQVIIFSHAQVTLSFSQEDKVFVFKMSGQVLAPENEKNQMLYLAVSAPATTGV